MFLRKTWQPWHMCASIPIFMFSLGKFTYTNIILVSSFFFIYIVSWTLVFTFCTGMSLPFSRSRTTIFRSILYLYSLSYRYVSLSNFLQRWYHSNGDQYLHPPSDYFQCHHHYHKEVIEYLYQSWFAVDLGNVVETSWTIFPWMIMSSFFLGWHAMS